LIASFVTVDDKYGSYRLKAYFSAFLFILMWSNVRIRRVFYTVKWRQYLVKVDYQYTVSCMLLFNVAYKKCKHIFNFVQVINRNSIIIIN